MEVRVSVSFVGLFCFVLPGRYPVNLAPLIKILSFSQNCHGDFVLNQTSIYEKNIFWNLLFYSFLFYSSNKSLPAFYFFPLKIVLILLGPLYFQINFKFGLPTPQKECVRTMILKFSDSTTMVLPA